MKKLFVFLLFLGIAGGAGYWLLTNKTVVAALPPRTIVVDRGDLTEKVSAVGRTMPDPKLIYYVGTDLLPAGKVVWLNPKAELGEFVTAGDDLIKLDDEYAKLQLDQAKAKKDAAESNIKKAEAGRLKAEAAQDRTEKSRKAAKSTVDALEEGIKKFGDSRSDIRANKEKELELAKESLSAFEAGVKEAGAAIKEADAAKIAADALVKEAEVGIRVAEKALKLLTIKASGSGTIIKKEITLGQVVTPSATPVLFVIADLNRMQVVATVGESDIARISEGMEVRFKIDAYTEEIPEFAGKVTRISKIPLTTPLGSGGQKTDMATLLTAPVLFPVVIDVLPLEGKPDFKLKAGLTTNVDFVLKKVDNALRVPSDALGYKPDQPTPDEEKRMNERLVGSWKPLWIQQQDGNRQLIFVETGISSDGKTEITKVDGKLEPGMHVIIEGPPAAQSGGLKLPFKL